jgi:hypothetical protein
MDYIKSVKDNGISTVQSGLINQSQNLQLDLELQLFMRNIILIAD